MKTFVKENWYKLMIGCSMFIFSISALIYSVAPAYANASKPIPAVSKYDFYVVGKSSNDNFNYVYGHLTGKGLDSWERTYSTSF